MTHSRVLTSALACASLLLAACGGHPPDPVGPPKGPALAGDFSGSGAGTLISAERLVTLDPKLRKSVSLAARIVYVSTSAISDFHPEVSGTVFVPKGDPPPGGWKTVALGHPATGIQPECAPSASFSLLGSAQTVTAIINAGFMVTMPDYQGLGLRGEYHPFLDSSTEGYNLIDSVQAARKLVPAASDVWAAYGVGQGGQAAWAANELTSDYNYQGSLSLVGAVAVTPAAALDGLADAAADGTLTRDQKLALQWYLESLDKEYEDFDLDVYRRGVARQNWDVLSACWGPASQERTKVAEQIGPDDLGSQDPAATEALRGYLRKTSLPQAPTAAPMLVVPGQDALMPQNETDAAVRRACTMGDVIQFGSPQGTDIQTSIKWIADRFSKIAPQNDCESSAPLTTQPPTG